MPRVLTALCFIAVLLTSCRSVPAPDKPVGSPIEIPAPLGLPRVPVPDDNPPTAETVALGRRLFFDTRLSRDNTVSCATCHDPAAAFADNRKVSAGVKGKLGTRNSPTVLNAAYQPVQFWDGRAHSLEDQAAGPIANPVEMDHKYADLVALLNSDGGYAEAFSKAFGPGGVTFERIAKAVASFERTALSGNSAFDRYRYAGDKSALSSAAIRGLAIFEDPQKGNCVTCHKIENEYALFTDGKFHNLGVGMDPAGELRDLGRYDQTKREADKGAFRTPTLRNIAKTAPYMHDGSQKTLREVVDFYVGGGNSNPYLDKEIHQLDLSRKERDDLIAFLESLNGDVPGAAK